MLTCTCWRLLLIIFSMMVVRIYSYQDKGVGLKKTKPTHSYQECALPTELCGSPTFYNGGGRIRTHVARTGGRFTVCSD
jgi:hypothetical protein